MFAPIQRSGLNLHGSLKLAEDMLAAKGFVLTVVYHAVSLNCCGKEKKSICIHQQGQNVHLRNGLLGERFVVVLKGVGDTFLNPRDKRRVSREEQRLIAN